MSTRSKTKATKISQQDDAGDPDPAMIAMNKIGTEFHEDEENAELIRDTDIEMECSENIYNAFLLLKFRNEADIKRARERSPLVVNSLGIVAYIIAISQWTALAFLIAVTALGYSGNASLSDLRGWKEEGDRPRSTFFLWPFFLFAVLSTARAGKQSDLDIRILKEMDIKLRWNVHVILLKMVTEQYMAYLGSLVYLFVLVIFTQNAAEWSQYDNLVVILNLLAYGTILEAHEKVYELFEPFVMEFMVQNAIQTKLFEGKYKKQGGYSFIDKSKYLLWTSFAILYTSVVQAVYSRRYAFCIGVGVAWIIVVLLPWGFYLTKEKRQ